MSQSLDPAMKLGKRLLELLRNPSAVSLQVLRDGSIRVTREENPHRGEDLE
jgi:hypothetical protein